MKSHHDVYAPYIALLNLQPGANSLAVQIEDIVLRAKDDQGFSERDFVEYLYLLYANMPHIYEELRHYECLFLPRHQSQ